MRVYTNKDQVEIFHFDVTPFQSNGCDKGQNCIIVADLDTQGDICKDEKCLVEEFSNNKKQFTVGEFLFLRISFKDKTYLKHL